MTIMSRFDLKGKRAVVTGASQGIGLASARALAEAGAHVLLTSRDEQALEKAADELASEGYSVEHRFLDVTDSVAVTALAEDLGAVDILFANAGIARSGEAAEEMADDVIADVMNVNFNGVVHCCRAFGRKMLAAGGGSIVVTGSISALISNRPQKQSYYNASKAAVHQMVKSMAGEWAARGVRINAVAPGYIETPMTKYGMEEDPETAEKWLELTPMGRVGQPDEIASIIVFLASPAASYMTGSVVVADGGYTCW
ncbi:SDR family NAD(P)-dependent oxidoreductase [Martelella radicis]|uniref:NAD(P)-dependent dehydrogenase (Short-subunit alcohol dehydrogenase family) n=1 Tax=Martelella radicis TaxID=1397476 RepID=A0A7W6KGR6_9HYPH|nr:SDR family oxidoreductase [Martelella radicis]MBB4120966.1 NAD(P)-dependent dehydrogenase (short-subunit alcohol dehydrogenase family) [Martelella radicis]